MEARRDPPPEQRQGRIPVRSVTQIAQNLVERAVLLHDVNNVLNFRMQETHHLGIRCRRCHRVTVIRRHRRGQTRQIRRGGNLSAYQRGVFQLKLILVIGSQLIGLRRVTARISQVFNIGQVAITIARVRTRIALAVDNVHPASVGAEGNIGWIVSGRDQPGRRKSVRPRERDHRDRVRTGIHRVKCIVGGVNRNRHRSRARGAHRQTQTRRTARVDPAGNRVGRCGDHRHLVRVVLRDIERRAVGAERHAVRVAVECNAGHEGSGCRATDVDRDHLTVPVDPDISSGAVQYHRIGERAPFRAARRAGRRIGPGSYS